jgi:hypothetical protein
MYVEKKFCKEKRLELKSSPVTRFLYAFHTPSYSFISRYLSVGYSVYDCFLINKIKSTDTYFFPFKVI